MFSLYTVFLKESVKRGLFDPDHLTVTGDGTEIIIASHLNYLSKEALEKKGIIPGEGERCCTQPFCDYGWDSHRKMHYAGYNCYMLTIIVEVDGRELPLFPLLLPASTHDAAALVEALTAFEKYLPDYHIYRIMLDSAHDSMDEAKFIKYGIKADGRQRNDQAITDLNPRRGINFEYQGFTVKERGVPICANNLELTHCGSDYTNERTRYMCPCLRGPSIKCPFEGCPQRYGTPFYTHVKDNPRLFTLPARCSENFDKLYKQRTASERVNALIKGSGYDIEESPRTTHKGWYYQLYRIMICIHVKAWKLEEEGAFLAKWGELHPEDIKICAKAK